MSLIIDEFDKVKLHALLGQAYAENNPIVADNVLNANAYRLAFLDSLDIESTMFEKYKNRLKVKGAIQDSKELSEFARLTLACNIKRPALVEL